MTAVRAAVALAAISLAAGPARGAVLLCEDAVGSPGGQAQVVVRIAAEPGEVVAGTQSDLVFDPTFVDLPSAAACAINPAIGSREESCDEDPPLGACKDLQRSLADCPDVGCPPDSSGLRRLRAIVVASGNVNPIPDAALYTCTFRIDADAPLGEVEILNLNVIASDPQGARLPAEAGSCAVVVAEPTVTPTPLPECVDDEDCPDGEVCVDDTCVVATPTPSPTPIGFCIDEEDCPEGQVCVDNRCVTPTPSPTPVGFCIDDEDCPEGEVCVDDMCVTPTPGSGGGGGCSCKIDPGAPATGTPELIAVLVPVLLLGLRHLARRRREHGARTATVQVLR